MWYIGDEPGADGWWVDVGGGGLSKRPVLQLIKGEILQVAGCLSQEERGQRQRVHGGGVRRPSFLGVNQVQYVDTTPPFLVLYE